MLAFQRANPKYGEMEGGEMNKEIVEPLPGCLESLLTKSVLVNAKRDEIQKTKNLMHRNLYSGGTLKHCRSVSCWRVAR